MEIKIKNPAKISQQIKAFQISVKYIEITSRNCVPQNS